MKTDWETYCNREKVNKWDNGRKKNGVTLKMGLCIREEFASTLSAPLYWHFSEACQAAVIATYQLSSLALLDHNVPVAKLGHNIICTSKHPRNFHLHTREVREAKFQEMWYKVSCWQKLKDACTKRLGWDAKAQYFYKLACRISLGGDGGKKKNPFDFEQSHPLWYTFSIIHTYRSTFATVNINNLAQWAWKSQYFPATVYMLNEKL